MRDFLLKENRKQEAHMQHLDGAFSLHHIGDDDYKVIVYDEDSDIENTLFFTYEQLKCLYLLLSKEN